MEINRCPIHINGMWLLFYQNTKPAIFYCTHVLVVYLTQSHAAGHIRTVHAHILSAFSGVTDFWNINSCWIFVCSLSITAADRTVGDNKMPSYHAGTSASAELLVKFGQDMGKSSKSFLLHLVYINCCMWKVVWCEKYFFQCGETVACGWTMLTWFWVLLMTLTKLLLSARVGSA